MADELTDLEREIEDTAVDDSPKDEDFQSAAGAEGDPDHEREADEPEPEPEPARRAPPEIADDLDVARQQAAHAAQEWDAWLAAKDQDLADARTALEVANDSGTTTQELVAAQVALQQAVLDQREAAKGAQQARDYHAQVARPRAPAAQAWIDANPKYKTDAAFRERASRIAAELQTDYRADGPLMYQELDRRLRARTPMGNRAARSGGAPTSRQPERAPGAADAAEATPFDQKWMRKTGLDPNNKRHLGEWKKHFKDLENETRYGNA
jgi:hypothetical protein